MTTAAPKNDCPYCGAVAHNKIGQCPSIKAIEYYQDGTVKRVEKHSPQTFNGESLFESVFGKDPWHKFK